MTCLADADIDALTAIWSDESGVGRERMTIN
jgi:hypothetical protein